MNQDLKAIMGWVTSFLIMALLGLVCYTGSRIIDGQETMNQTLTTILVNQSDLNRRVTSLEARTDDHDQRWKEREITMRQFFETYDLKRKQ